MAVRATPQRAIQPNPFSVASAPYLPFGRNFSIPSAQALPLNLGDELPHAMSKPAAIEHSWTSALLYGGHADAHWLLTGDFAHSPGRRFSAYENSLPPDEPAADELWEAKPTAPRTSTVSTGAYGAESVTSDPNLQATPAVVREITERLDRFVRQAEEFQRCAEGIVETLSSILKPNVHRLRDHSPECSRRRRVLPK